MQTFLVVSTMALWISVVVLAIAIYALTRLIREFLASNAAASARTRPGGMPTGVPAPAFSETTVTGAEAALGTRYRKPTFLLFTGSGCIVCEHVLAQIIEHAAQWSGLPGPFYVINDGAGADMPPDLPFEFVTNSELHHVYRVPTFPQLVIVDAKGYITSYAPVTSWKEVSRAMRSAIGAADLREEGDLVKEAVP